MENDFTNSVPNLSREEINAQLDFMRQKQMAKRANAQRTLWGRFVLLLAVLFSWTGGGSKPRPMCYRMPGKPKKAHKPIDGEQVPEPEEDVSTPEPEEPKPAEESQPAKPKSTSDAPPSESVPEK